MDEIVQNFKSVMLNWGDFQGRSRRRVFWYFALANFALSLVAGIIDHVVLRTPTMQTGLLQGLYSLVVLVPSLSLAFRRLHDIGKSAWWLLICFIPILGWIAILYFYCKDSDADNQYGPNPKTIA